MSESWVRPSLLLLASGHGFGGRLPPVRCQAVQRRERHAGPDRHGLSYSGRRRGPHLDRRPRGKGVPERGGRVVDGEPPSRLPGVRRGRGVPSPGHDGHGRPCLPPVQVPEAHLPQSGSGPLRQSRDEPLHPVLPLRALLSRLRGRSTTWWRWERGTRSTSAATPTGSWRASSAATWWRSVPPACSPTRPSRLTSPANGICRPPLRCACIAGLAATRYRASATACCAGYAAATTATSTGTSSVTEAGSDTSL